ncbi:hypothetical protein, partial [Parabacteroides sp.]
MVTINREKTIVLLLVAPLKNQAVILKDNCFFRDYPQFCVNSKQQEPNPSLNLDSVFKYSQKLIKNQSPVPYGLIPFFL